MRLPSKENYQKFIERFTKELSEKHPDICLYLYGSNLRDDLDLGTSDIDGGIILDSEIITPKDKIKGLSKILSLSQSTEGIKTQFNLLDRQTNKDGRFLSYETNYITYIRQRAEIFGPDFIKEIKSYEFRSGPTIQSARNLRSLRNLLLYSEHLGWKNYKEFAEEVIEASRKAVKFPKNLILLQEKVLIENREKAIEKLTKMLPYFNPEKLLKLNQLTRNPE